VIVVYQADELRDTILQRRVAGDSVGFVPTMGMLRPQRNFSTKPLNRAVHVSRDTTDLAG